MYHHLLNWHLPRIPLGSWSIDLSLHHFVNDGLMALFFLVVALEIKREILGGQLSDRKALLLPLLCAFAGVAAPALIFVAFNRGDAQALRAWAVPTATDIAFALGVLALLGTRAALGMKLLLSTIAVIDDLIAIVIIALFYTASLHLPSLLLAVVCLAAMWLLNRLKVKPLWPYLLLALLLWIVVLRSGVHATLAGVATGFLIPYARDDAHSPLHTLEHALHPWVAYLVLPLFAFANAGLDLQATPFSMLQNALPLGVMLGLVLGKPIGIFGMAWLASKAKWVSYPEGMDHNAMFGISLLCGIGFTMSLFIGSLAFGESPLFAATVLAVFVASIVAALAGLLFLRLSLKPR